MPPEDETFLDVEPAPERLRARSLSERVAKNPLLVPGAILVGALIIGVSLIIGFSQMGAGSGSPGTPSAAEVNIEDVKISGEPYIGKENAPVVMAYWSDYQCPFCKAFEVGGVQGINAPAVLPVLIKNYVDKGTLKIVFKDFAFLSEDSDTAALWGRAIWDLYPGKYWEWREAMYHAQDEEHGGFGDAASILALTRKISGVDANAVKARVVAQKDAYTKLIEAERHTRLHHGHPVHRRFSITRHLHRRDRCANQIVSFDEIP